MSKPTLAPAKAIPSRLQLTQLEDRSVPAVTTFTAGVLTINIDNDNEQVTATSNAGTITLSSTNGITGPGAGGLTGVNSILTTSTKAGTLLRLDGVSAFNLSGGLSTTGVSLVELSQDVVGTVNGNAQIVGVNSPGQIQDGVDVAGAGASIYVGVGTFTENIRITKSVKLYGAQVGNNALFARGPETRITTPTNNPEGPNPGGNDLIRILADDVDVAGFLLDGNNPALPASTVMGNGIDIHARRAITNIDVDGNRVGRSGFQIFNNVIKNFAEDAIVFSNAGTPNTGGYMVQNDISNYGAGNNFPYAGVYLENGATIATLSYNRFVETAGGNWGIFSFQNTTSPSQFWQGNTITTGQNSKGIVVNKQTGGSLIISDNLFLAGPGVTVTPGTSLSVAVQVQNMTSGSNLILSNNNIGTAGGTYDRGFDFFNIGNAQLIGGIISNSIIGINVDAEDVLLTPSTGNTNLQILNPNMFVPSNGVGAFLRGLSTGNDTFNINVPGNLNSVTFAGSKVSYSGLNNLLVDGQGGTNSFNINFGGGTVPTTINVLNSGSTGANILNIYGTSGSDLFNINTLFANTFILNTSNLVGYNGIATLNVNGPAFPGDSTPVTPTATDAGDSATITVSASTVVIFNGGNPNLPLGSPSGDKLYVRKGGTLILSPDFGPNYGKDGFLFTNNVFDNVGWTNME